VHLEHRPASSPDAAARPTSGSAPPMTYNGPKVQPLWGHVLSQGLREHIDPGTAREEIVVEYVGHKRVVRRGGELLQLRRPWRARRDHIVVAELVRPLREVGERQYAPDGAWSLARTDRHQLADPGVWRHEGLDGRAVHLASRAHVARSDASSATIHADRDTAQAWALLPTEARRLAERLSPLADATWAEGIPVLFSSASDAREVVRYARGSREHVVALQAWRARGAHLQRDAGDAGAWEVAMVGGAIAGSASPLEQDAAGQREAIEDEPPAGRLRRLLGRGHAVE